MSEKTRDIIILSACFTIESVVLIVIIVMLSGLFHPSVDNDKVFALLSPAFQTIIGCLVGLLGGMRLSQSNTKPPEMKGQ